MTNRSAIHKAMTLARLNGFFEHVRTCPCEHFVELLTPNLIDYDLPNAMADLAGADERSIDHRIDQVRTKMKKEYGAECYTAEEARAGRIIARFQTPSWWVETK